MILSTSMSVNLESCLGSLPGQKYIPISKGITGITAEPICSLQAILGSVWNRARFALNPLMKAVSKYCRPELICISHRRMPKATQICHPITKLPLIYAGVVSAAYIGMVEALTPIPKPRNKRQTRSCCQVCVNAEPRTKANDNIAAKRIAPRRPKR